MSSFVMCIGMRSLRRASIASSQPSAGTVSSISRSTLKLTFFACVETDAADDWFYSTGRCCQNRAGLLRHIRSLGGVQMGTEPQETQGVAAFSTCSDARTNGRVVLLAKIEPEEKRGAEML